jgi:hypothetical protein
MPATQEEKEAAAAAAAGAKRIAIWRKGRI